MNDNQEHPVEQYEMHFAEEDNPRGPNPLWDIVPFVVVAVVIALLLFTGRFQ